MLSLDEMVRLVAIVAVLVACGFLVWVGAAVVVRTPRRGETAGPAAARLDACAPAEPPARSVEVEAVQSELMRLQAEMTRRALVDERPSGPTVVVVDGRDTTRSSAEELSAFEDPPALSATPRRRDDRGNMVASTGFLVFFVLGLLIFGYVQEHGAEESAETWNRCSQAGMRALTHSDADALDGCTTDDGKTGPGRAWGSTSTGELRAALGRVEVVDGRPEVDGYDRSEFGPEWTDEYEGPAGGNDCDTRSDVLAAQMRHTRREDGCVVARGTLADPYTGQTLRFDRASDPSAVQVDHVVPLSAAWDMGAAEWSGDKRRVFANDAARNLVATDGPTNQAKGDQPPAEWLPPNRAARCEYLHRYLVVADYYELPITKADAAVVREQAPRCRGGER